MEAGTTALMAMAALSLKVTVLGSPASISSK